MNIETINALEQAIKNENLLKKYNLDKIGVFGSFARGEKAHRNPFSQSTLSRQGSPRDLRITPSHARSELR